MFNKNNKLSITSTAGEILDKVNQAISDKEKPQNKNYEDDSDVLELTEEVNSDYNSEDIYDTSPSEGEDINIQDSESELGNEEWIKSSDNTTNKKQSKEQQLDAERIDEKEGDQLIYNSEETSADQSPMRSGLDKKSANNKNVNDTTLKAKRGKSVAAKSSKNKETISKVQQKSENQNLISQDTAEATSALFQKLRQSAKHKKDSDTLKFESGITMEELVAELIKPHLSEWLDENLPSIVKEVVEKEVKKLMPSD